MKNKDLKILLLAAALAMPVVTPAFAVSPLAVNIEPVASTTLDSRLQTARTLYNSGNYRGTLDQLRALIIAGETSLTSREEQEFLFLLGGSAFKCDLPETEYILNDYLAKYPASENSIEVKLLSADYYFFKHQWSEALEIYRTVNKNILDSNKSALYTYREALCRIKCGFYREAVPLLSDIEKNKKYMVPAKYYRAYIYYVEGQDSQAMKLFKEVESEIATKPLAYDTTIAPKYYIAQLLFRQGNWKEASTLAKSLLKDGKIAELQPAMLRVQGLSQYETGDYSSALPILEKYEKATGDDASHDALYALGVCLYNAQHYSEADKCFKKIVEDHDAVGQGASLYLGQIAASREDASSAAINFERAYRMNYDNRVAETALYDYVAARARGGNIPFDSNVEMLEEFIRNYPESEYAPLIEHRLAGLYYSGGDYDNALRVAERIKNPSAEDMSLLQTILYGGGTSALSAGNPAKASRWLKRCVDIKEGSPETKTQAEIWLGDAYYDLGEYKDAEAAYKAAEKSGKAGDNLLHLKYNLGYAQLMQNKFSDAAGSFNSLLSSSVNLPADLRRDARLRIADSKYYAGIYSEAKTDFKNLINGDQGTDYAIYRYAQILGIEGNLTEKIAQLKRLENEYGDSKWISNALTELADTYVSAGQNKEAAAAYSRMLAKFPVDPAAPRAQLGMGAALMASGDKTAGASAYREVIRRWPASEQARIADRELRDYYAEEHQLNEYATFINSIPGYSLDAKEMESLAYNVAEREYLDFPKSLAPLTKYLEEYPEGNHSAEAWQLVAQHYYEDGDSRNALAAYRELEKRGGAEYANEAYAGIMRTADNVAVRGEYARKLMNSGAESTDILEEAEFYIAESQLKDNAKATRLEAEKKLRELGKNAFSEFGARSAVTLGEYLLEQKRNKEALSLMEDFTSSGTGQHYWLAKGFIVMADAMTANGDKYTAQEYLKSLKRNYPGKEPDILREIDRRLK